MGIETILDNLGFSGENGHLIIPIFSSLRYHIAVMNLLNNMFCDMKLNSLVIYGMSLIPPSSGKELSKKYHNYLE